MTLSGTGTMVCAIGLATFRLHRLRAAAPVPEEKTISSEDDDHSPA